MDGRIVNIIGNNYLVDSGDKQYSLLIKGIFRYKNITPVVGDYVSFDPGKNQIISIQERKTLLKRPRISNVNKILIITSLVEPDFDLDLVLKYITYANLNDIHASVVITKIDKNYNLELYESIQNIFSKLNLDYYFVSTKTQEGVEEIKAIINKKTIVLVGQTGVGKSSLLNAIEPSFDREIGEYSVSRGRGKHQTKEVKLFKFNDGYIADSPGFSAFELDLDKETLAKFYPFMYKNNAECFYSNCLHISESKCKIKEMVDNGDIPIEVYNSYLRLIDTLPDKRRY